MANTGYDWGAWAAVTKSGTGDWTALAISDNGNAGSTAIDLDKKAACEVGFSLVEDNTGAIDGVVTAYVLGSIDGTNYEEMTPGQPWSFTVTPVINDTVNMRFNVDPAKYGDFKFWLLNEGGQTLATTVKYRTADIPVAS